MPLLCLSTGRAQLGAGGQQSLDDGVLGGQPLGAEQRGAGQGV